MAIDLDGAQVPGMGGLAGKFTASSIMAGIVFGAAGFYFFREGKKEGNFWNMILGIVMMVYPMLITGDILVWVVGVALFWVAWKNR